MQYEAIFIGKKKDTWLWTKENESAIDNVCNITIKEKESLL